MTIRIGWLSPFNGRTGVGTFSKAVTDAMPADHGGEAIDVTLVTQVSWDTYPTRHRLVDIRSASPDSGFFDLFDVLVYNIGNNSEHHLEIFEVLRRHPGIVICHDYVYQHFLAGIIAGKGSEFRDYVALIARYGEPDSLRLVSESNITGRNDLRFGPWDTEFCSREPLAAPILHLGSAAIVHSQFAETYVRDHFTGPLLRLGMPFDQRPHREVRIPERRGRRSSRLLAVTYGHVQATKCLDDVILAMASSEDLRKGLDLVVAGYDSQKDYVERLRQLVRAHDLSDQVRFDFNLSDEQLAELSDAADLFINLRRPNTEGASVSLIEQLDTGKPVVVISTGCYAEVPGDAVFKVAEPYSVVSLRDTLQDALSRSSEFGVIGEAGRAYARRYDCASYCDRLLAFVQTERRLLHRRMEAKAQRLIEISGAGPDGHPRDEAWSEALSLARLSFDHLDRGTLFSTPAIHRELSGDALVDYVQATLIREGRDPAIREAVRAYLAGKPDPYRAVKMLSLSQDLAANPSEELSALFVDLCDRSDFGFWAMLSVLGEAVMEACAHQAFFGSQPSERLFLGPSRGFGNPLQQRALSAAIRRRHAEAPSPFAAELDALVTWLGRDQWQGTIGDLASFPRGRKIVVGSNDWHQHLHLQGFHLPESNHAWSGESALILVKLPEGAERVTVFGHRLETVTSSAVRFAATVGPRTARRAQTWLSDDLAFEIDVTDRGDCEDLAISISASPCVSPADLGLSSDTRRLGFCLTEVGIH